VKINYAGQGPLKIYLTVKVRKKEFYDKKNYKKINKAKNNFNRRRFLEGSKLLQKFDAPP